MGGWPWTYRPPPRGLIMPNDQFYIRTRQPDQLDVRTPWKSAIHGLVQTPRASAQFETIPDWELTAGAGCT